MYLAARSNYKTKMKKNPIHLLKLDQRNMWEAQKQGCWGKKN